MVNERRKNRRRGQKTTIIIQAKYLLNGDKVVALWTKMNQWVYDGFAIT
jgi:hypothetical protein